ncbi:ribosome-binding protein [Maublancomyces gigas]|uniref:60S ribosomal export protein NMD3 n=1 Tax=Discina gigas TaxID=1032678 RepID=A0ABR3G6G0_9PEZI
MEIDDSVQMLPFTRTNTIATILCATCGAPIDGSTGVAMCYDCIKLNVDISEGIQREATIHFCRGCDRWLQPPSHWVSAALESRELLALCLRRLRGLTKVRIIDASFIWTEPHSKRVKVKITVQQEAFESTILQQSFEVEYVVAYHQCPDCAKSYTANTWRACVQVRQKVPHKRTFLYLEQLILKHNAHRDTVNIRETKDGLDFFYAQRNHATKMVDFLAAVAPVRSQKSSELISTDIHTSTKSYKFTYSVELVPICKDDLVCIPLKLARSLGNIPPLLLCTKIGNSIHLMDPNTLQLTDITTNVYWRAPFNSLADVSSLVEFIILDIEPLGPTHGKHVLADVTVARASDMASNNTTYLVRTHLGAILHPGDSALGYHITGANLNNEHFEELERHAPARIPDVILVKKSYPRKKKNRSRAWKLQRMTKDESEMLPRKQDQERAERDYEMFLREVEEDVELRGTLALYKSSRKNPPSGVRMEGVEKTSEAMDVEETDDDEEEEELPEISMEELLDEFDELNVKDRG